MCPCCSAVKFQSNCLWGEERFLLVILSGENGLVFQLCPCSVPVSLLSAGSLSSVLLYLVQSFLLAAVSLSLSGELVTWPWHTLHSVSLINHTITEFQTGGATCYFFLFLSISKLSFSPSYLFLMPVEGQGWHWRRQWGTDFCSDLSWSARPYEEGQIRLKSTYFICIHYQSNCFFVFF